MTWQFSPYAIPLFASALPLVASIVVAWRRRAHLAARLFLGFSGGALGLVLTYGFELTSADLKSMLFWLRLEYFCQWGLVFWPLFALAYSGYGASITRGRVAALFVLPVVTLALVWTNESHGLIWRTTGVQMVGPTAMFDRTYGFMLWLWFGYLAFLFVAGYIILIRKAVRTPGYFRGEASWLTLALVLPAIGMILTITRLTPVPLLDLSPYGIALGCIPLAIALFRFRLFDLVPAAYEHIIHSMGDAVIVCDSQYRIVQANPAAAALAGQPAAWLRGRAIEQLISEVAGAYPDMRRSASGRMHEMIVTGTGANARSYDLQVSPLRNQQNVITGQVFVLRDITDRVRAERQMLDLAVERERVRVLKTFIETASHDFRTPISAITTSAHLLERLAENTGERLAASVPVVAASQPQSCASGASELGAAVARMRDKAQGIQVSALRLAKLVESMLEVTQLEDTSRFEFAPRDLGLLLDNCAELYRGAAADKELRLVVERDVVAQIRADACKLGYALRQLIENAIHYTPSGGAITIRTCLAGERVVIEIRDTGIGISSAELPRIFEPLYRADQARSDSTGGSGLGLPIARRIVEAHGGRIEVSSVIGEGSTFRICLPLDHSEPVYSSLMRGFSSA